ncbi:MAG: family 20 glycosylhydrolase, partial [Pyrinomonadaceae bacterium]
TASFRLDRKTNVTLADSGSADDRFAAQDFINDVTQTIGLALRIGKRRGNSILVGKLDLPAIQSALKIRGITVPTDLNDEGYVLHVDEKGVVVGGQSAAGVFYGLQTLKQLVRGDSDNASVQGVQIVDWPAMRWRGVSDDISRGPVPTVDYIKRQLRTFASFKLNLHSFYMEQTFSSSEHPLIGPMGGSLTPDEIRELVAYAKSYHMELVPEQQTFGHLHKALQLEKYSNLAETPYGDVLSPQQEGTYKLIADWYRELNDLFPGRFFHIGEDETFELGEGQSREAARARGVGAIYFEHLNRVRDLLKPYNRRLMFWGDIALNHPDLIGNIPKEMIVMNWDYAPKDDFSARIKPFKDAGLDQFVCPGVSNWNQIFPNIESSSKNIVNFVRDGRAAGALGMMNTTWDDDGESLFESSWYAIVLGATASWQSVAVDLKPFDEDFDWSFFRNDGHEFVKAIHALGSVNTVLGIGTTDDPFWRDPFTNEFQNFARNNAEKIRKLRLQVEDAEELLLRNRRKAKRNASMIPVMILAAKRFDHLGRRAETAEKLSREYWDAYLAMGDRVKARRLRRYTGAIYNQLREMAEELSILKASYRDEWLAENRPYWLDSILARYDQAIALWLNKSRELDEALRNYEATSTLPNPEKFGVGPRFAVPRQ